MNTIVDYMLTVIFPKKESTLRLHRINFDDLTHPQSYDFKEIYPNIYCITRYKNPLIRALIHAAKFHGDQKCSEKIAACLARHLDRIIESRMVILPDMQIIIIPLPSTPSRKRVRGWNQCEIIAQYIPSWSTQRPMVSTDILYRKDSTTFQKKLSRSERLIAQKNSFVAQRKYSVAETVVIVIDDIVTTGATLTEAIKTLNNAGYTKVFGLAFAH